MPSRTRRAPFLVPILAVLAAGIAGCGSKTGSTPGAPAALGGIFHKGPGGYLVAAFDRTGSTENEKVRGRQVSELFDIVHFAHVKKAHTTLWALDHAPVVISDNPVPPDTDDRGFLETIQQQLGLKAGNNRDAANNKIARPGLLLRDVDKRLAEGNLPEGPLVLFISTDGAAEDHADNVLFAKEAAKISKAQAGLHVIISGIRPENRDAWANAFAALGDRYYAGGPSEQDETLAAFKKIWNG